MCGEIMHFIGGVQYFPTKTMKKLQLVLYGGCFLTLMCTWWASELSTYNGSTLDSTGRET